MADPAQGYGSVSEDVRQDKLQSRMDAFHEMGVRAFAKSRGPKLLSSSATEEHVQCVVDVMSKLNESGYEQAAQMLGSGDLLADAQQYHGPILILCGDEDAVTLPDAAQQLAAGLESAEYRPIEGAGHASYVEQGGALR